jgi:hypothetical protein
LAGEGAFFSLGVILVWGGLVEKLYLMPIFIIEWCLACFFTQLLGIKVSFLLNKLLQAWILVELEEVPSLS